jgi:hypothetical protein
MGYTHYWTPKNSTKEQFKKFSNTCKELHKNLPDTTDTAGGYHSDDEVKICGGDGKGKPKFTSKEVCFNGDGKNDLDHETFYIALDYFDWTFCKTARKPYDLLVCACLLAARDILKFDVSSDGDFEDWKPAIDFYVDTIYTEKPDLTDIVPENFKELV